MVTSGRVERDWIRERGPARAVERMEASARDLDSMVMMENKCFWTGVMVWLMGTFEAGDCVLLYSRGV
jgi:hypothetical protein